MTTLLISGRRTRMRPDVAGRWIDMELALNAARSTLLFFHEMGGYTTEPVRNVIHDIDRALGNNETELKVS